MTDMLNAYRRAVICASLLAGVLLPATARPNVRALAIANKPWTGDFDQMVQRRMIRVLVPYSRTLFFNDKGRERGLTAELVHDFERYLNQKHRPQLGKRPITVFIIATTRDTLLSDVAAGLGDIAAGNLTITEDRTTKPSNRSTTPPARRSGSASNRPWRCSKRTASSMPSTP